MAQCGRIVFYLTAPLRDVQHHVRKSFELMGVTTAESVWQSRGPDQSWKAFLGEVDDDERIDCVGQNVTADEFAVLVRPDRVTRTLMGETPLGSIWKSIAAHIPESIRGNFNPAEPAITVGEHDHFDATENEEGTYFGRATFAFSLFGYGSPNDWPACRKLIFEVPALHELEQRIAAFAGPVQRCVYWDT